MYALNIRLIIAGCIVIVISLILLIIKGLPLLYILLGIGIIVLIIGIIWKLKEKFDNKEN